MNNDLMFIGMNFVESTKDILEHIEPQMCYGMTDVEYKGYEFGVKTVLSFMEQLLDEHESNEVFLHIKGINGQEEFNYEDLIKKLEE